MDHPILRAQARRLAVRHQVREDWASKHAGSENDPFLALPLEALEDFQGLMTDLTLWMGNVNVYHLKSASKRLKNRALRAWLKKYVNEGSYTLYYGRRLERGDEPPKVGDILPRKGSVLQWSTRRATSEWFAGLGTVNTPSWAGGALAEATVSGDQVLVDIDRLSLLCGRHKASFSSLITRTDVVQVFSGETYEGEVLTTPRVQGTVIAVQMFNARSARAPLQYVYKGPEQADQQWKAIQKAATDFNHLYNMIRSWGRMSEDKINKELPRVFKDTRWELFGPVGHPLNTNEPLGQWVYRNVGDSMRFSMRAMKVRERIRKAATSLDEALRFPSDSLVAKTPKQWLGELIEGLEAYVGLINEAMRQAGPRHFKYQGFNIENPDRMSDTTVKKLLAGVDYVVGLFQRRGVTPLLQETVNTIVLRHQSEGETAHGWHDTRDRTIELLSVAAGKVDGRMLRDWVNEVFLHEVGHHVHLVLMHPSARKEWDAGWDPVYQAEQADKEAERQLKGVSQSDRERFWDLLVKSGGSLRSITLKGLDRMKFHAWLAEPMTGSSLVTSKQLRWSKPEGEWLREFLEDPRKYIEENRGYHPSSERFQKALETHWKLLEDKLGVASSFASYMHPVLSDDQVAEYAKADSQVAQALKDLKVPTGYAETNEKEDFAESFVAFMSAPEALSDVARFRMQRALSLSGLYGKPIMRLAARPIPIDKVKVSGLAQQIMQELPKHLRFRDEPSDPLYSQRGFRPNIWGFDVGKFITQDVMGRLAFDPRVFAQAAGVKLGVKLADSGRRAALGDLLLELRKDLEEAGVSRMAGAVVRVANRWMQAAGTEQDITDNLRAYAEAFADYGAVINQVQYGGLDPTSYQARLAANKPWVALIDRGFKITHGILSTRAIPPRQAKTLELALRLFSNSRRMPQDILKWWGTNQKKLSLVIEATRWPEKQEGTDDLFKVGPFTVHNTIGATGPVLDAFRKALEAVIKAVNKNVVPGFTRVLYGDIYLVGQLTRSNTAAWYSTREDKVYARLVKKAWGFDDAFALVHELGHRYWRKFANKAEQQEWVRHHERVQGKDVEVPMPDVGDPLPLRVRGAPRGWRPIVKSKDKANYYFDYPTGTQGSVLVFTIWKVQRTNKADALKFPTAYSGKNEEEHFCEAVALQSFGQLTADHKEAFEAIWT